MAFISLYKQLVLSTLKKQKRRECVFCSFWQSWNVWICFSLPLIFNLFVFFLIAFVPLTAALAHSSLVLCPETVRPPIGPFGVHVQRHAEHQICRLVFGSGLEAYRRLPLDKAKIALLLKKRRPVTSLEICFQTAQGFYCISQ